MPVDTSTPLPKSHTRRADKSVGASDGAGVRTSAEGAARGVRIVQGQVTIIGIVAEKEPACLADVAVVFLGVSAPPPSSSGEGWKVRVDDGRGA